MSTACNKYTVLLQYLVLWGPCFAARSQVIVQFNHLAKEINAINTTWKAAISADLMDIWKSVNLTRDMVQLDEPSGIGYWQYGQYKRLPKAFDAREAWPMCKSVMTRIRQQGRCGSCWAVSGASVMSDRLCIGSGGGIQVHLSAEDLLTCCTDCLITKNLCKGGYGLRAFQYWKKHGVVTGGERRSKKGCKPYSDSREYTRGKACSKKCTNPAYSVSYQKDKYFSTTSYKLPSGDVTKIQLEILTYGPVMALMTVYQDFLIYEAGVYTYEKGPRKVNHYVKLIGWGVEGKKKYWLGVNSWGKKWGLKGFFKILRGENHVNIEREIITERTTNYHRQAIVNNSVRNQRMSCRMSIFYLFAILNYATS